MPELSGWAEHLTNPYALAGFAVLMFFTFIALTLKKQGKLSNPTFIIVILLSALVVVFVVSRLFPVADKGTRETGTESSDRSVSSSEDKRASTFLTTEGEKSPAIISNGNVNVRYE